MFKNPSYVTWNLWYFLFTVGMQNMGLCGMSCVCSVNAVVVCKVCCSELVTI
jgi:hypothetical protein